jgi:hypothetical protein
VFHLDVAYVAVAMHICCKRIFQMFHLFQRYVVASVFISSRGKQAHAEAVPTDAGGLCVRAGSEAGMGGLHLHA